MRFSRGSAKLRQEGYSHIMDSATKERRRRDRHKLRAVIRVRPSVPQDIHFEEIVLTTNVCRDGIYFFTRSNLYRKGLRLFITFPYSNAPGAINKDYLGEVSRVHPLTSGDYGIAIQLLSSIALEVRDQINRSRDSVRALREISEGGVQWPPRFRRSK